ncbi:MAG: calcium-binding protein, partial [Candidatus Didemnitutus sp.]|nr:calcium-binding protein [Candidatus Didemnitutus sp.]
FTMQLGNGTTTYVDVTAGSGAFLINSAGYAATISASVALLNVPGISINNTPFTVTLAKLTRAVNETITVGVNSYAFDLAAGSLVRVSATPLSVTVAGLTLTGKFSFEQSTNLAGSKVVIVSGADISIPNFAGSGSGGSPVSITNAQGLFVISDAGFAGTLSFTANLAIGVFAAGATLTFELNDTNAAVDVEGVFGKVLLEAGRYTRIVINDLKIAFPGIEISGDFSFKSAIINGVSQQVIVGANVIVFVGDNVSATRVGLELTGGEAIFLKEGELLAGRITGTVTLVGVTGVTFSATMTLRLNQFTTAVSNSAILDGKNIDLSFSATETSGFIQFIGDNIKLSIADTLELYGNFAFTRTTNKFTLGVTGGEVFVGKGPYRNVDGTLNTAAIGVRVHSIDFAMVVYTNVAGKYAYSGLGSLSFVGMSGLSAATDSLGLKFGVKQNKTGAPLSETIAASSTVNVVLSFADGTADPTFIGGLTISVPDVFTLTGTVAFTPRANGNLDIKVTSASLTFGGGDYGLSGTADMVITPADGFKLVSFAITGATIAGTTLAFAPAPAAKPGEPSDPSTPTTNFAQSTTTLNIGPLKFVNPGVSLADFSFKDGVIVITLELTLASATLAFGGSGSTSAQTSSGITATITGLTITFDVGVDLADGLSISPTGKWKVEAVGLLILVPKVFELTAANMTIAYDPAGSPDQELVSFASIALKVLPVDVTGQATNLVIRANGFTVGEASITYNPEINLGSVLSVTGLTVGVTNWSVNFDGTAQPAFNGSIFIAAHAASLTVGGSVFTATFTDSTRDTDLYALRVDLQFEAGKVKGLVFRIDTMVLSLGGFLNLKAEDFYLDTSAGDDDPMAIFGEIGASVKIGSFELGGFARNFHITGNGTFKVGNPLNPSGNFAVGLEIGGATGENFKWPKWLPIQIQSIALEWEDFEADPGDFDIILTASISTGAIPGFTFTGALDGIRIRPSLLLAGQFPVVDIAGFGVTVSGMGISGGLIGGILKITKTGDVYGVGDEFTPQSQIHDRVLFIGIEGSMMLAGAAGFGVRVAFSELGPLGMVVSVAIPGGIMLEPNTGLSINNFTAGVEFFKTLPSIDEPFELRDPAFDVTGAVEAGAWLAAVKSQVFNQYKAVQANPALGGFGAAFTAPMLIKGSAKIFTAYTSQTVFNGQVDIIISTDGKILIRGALNFAADLISISGKLYIDLSNIASGAATVLFLADIPDQARLLSIDGKLKMGFRNDSGAEVEIPVVSAAAFATQITPTAQVMSPTGPTIDAGRLNLTKSANDKYYIDILYSPGALGTLDYASILDADAEFTAVLTKANGTVVTLQLGQPVPLTRGVDADGVPTETIVTAADQAALILQLKNSGVQLFRYEITNAGFAWDSGNLQVDFIAGSFGQTVVGTPPAPVNEGVVVTPAVGVFTTSGTHHVDLLFTAGPSTALNYSNILNSSTGFSATITTTTGSVFTVALSGTPVPIRINVAENGTVTEQIITAATQAELITQLEADQATRFRFAITTVGFTWDSGTQTVASITGDFGQTPVDPLLSRASSAFIAVQGATAALASLGSGGTAAIKVLNAQGYIDIRFTPTQTSGSLLNMANAPPIALTGLGAGTAVLSSTGVRQGTTNVYRYTFTGAFAPGEIALTIAAGGITETSGLNNLSQVLRTTVQGSTATIAGIAPSATIGITALQTRGYFDITFAPGMGTTVTAESLLDTDAEFTVTLADGTQLVVSGVPTLQGTVAGNSTYRYTFTGTLVAGKVLVTFLGGSFTDNLGTDNVETSIEFIVARPTAVATSFTSGGNTDSISLNTLGHFEFTLTPATKISAVIPPTNAIPRPLNTVNATSVTAADLSITVYRVTAYDFLGVAMNGTANSITLSGHGLAENSVVTLVQFTSGSLPNQLATGEYYVKVVDANTIQLSLTSGGDAIDFTTKDASASAKFQLTARGDAVTGFAITGVTQVMEGTTPTNRFQFTFSGDFTPASLKERFEIVLSMAQGAWTDADGNESEAFTSTLTVRKPATTFFISLAGGVTFDAAGLTDEPLLEIRGFVDFEATTTDTGVRFKLSFGGTFKVVYLGNLGSVAGVFFLDLSSPVGVDPDAVTVRDLLADIGITVPAGTVFDINLPKLWGVLKIETNLEFLKNIGIDMKIAGTFQINTTQTAKTESLRLEGIPGTVFATAATTDSAISGLGSGTISAGLLALFTGENSLGASYTVNAIIPDQLWRVIDTVTKKQYFIQVANTGDITSSTASTNFVFQLKNDTQTFVLEAKTLLIGAYAYGKFSIADTEVFSISGAFSIKLKTTSLEMFADGHIVFSPGGTKIFEARLQALLIIRTDGMAGKFKLGASLQFPGVSISGALEVVFNTYARDVVFSVPTFLRAVVGYDSITITGKPMKLNGSFDPTSTSVQDALVTDTAAAASAYLAIGGVVTANVIDALDFNGAFFIQLSGGGFELQAAVKTELRMPVTNAVIFSLKGSLSLKIDGDGLYGRAELERFGAAPGFPPGFTLAANFIIEINTATIAKEIRTYSFSTTTGAKGLVEEVKTIRPLFFQFIAGGTLSFTVGGVDLAQLVGRFEFTIAAGDGYFQVAISAKALVGGSEIGSAAGGFRLGAIDGTPYIAAFIQIQIGVGAAPDAPPGQSAITGTGFEIQFRLAFFINTSSTPITINGITLAAAEVKLSASGFIQFSIAGVAGFRIEGEMGMVANGTGFELTVAGTLTAQVGGVIIFSSGVSGALSVTNAGTVEVPIYAIAGFLAIELNAGSVLNGNGFGFTATFRLEVNTTSIEKSFTFGGSTQTLSAGIYVRLKATGSIFIGTASTGFLLSGTFFLEVGTAGLIISATATLKLQIANTEIISFTANGALLIGPSGIAAKITITLGVQSPLFTLAGSLLFEVNTTGSAIATIGLNTVNLPAGPYMRVQVTGTITLLSILSLDGSATFLFQGDLLKLEITASANLNPLGSLNATGSLTLSSAGMWGSLSLAGSLTGIPAISFSGAFLLAINTTNSAKTVKVLNVDPLTGTVSGQKDMSIAASTIIVSFGGTLTVGFFQLKGSAMMTMGSDGFAIEFNASLDLAMFGKLRVSGGAIISKGGGSPYFALRLNLGVSELGFGLISISGEFILELNTRNQVVNIAGVDVAANSFKVALSAKLKIWVFTVASVSAEILYSNGHFRFSFSGGVNFFNIFTINVSGYIQSNGHFEITGSSSFRLDFGPVYFEAGISVTLAHWGFAASGYARVGLYIDFFFFEIDIHFGLSFSISFNLERGEATFSFSIWKFSFSIVWSFGAPPILATKIGSELRINVGVDARHRGAGYTTDNAESVTITHVSGTRGNETVKVSALGYTQTYSGISKIIVNDAGNGDDVIMVSAGVLSDAEINGGVGNDTLSYLGSGNAIIRGGAGNDTIYGGSGNDFLYGGDGDDYIHGGAGDDHLFGGAGNDTLIGGAGNDRLDGGEGDDTLTGNGGNDVYIFSGNFGNDTIDDQLDNPGNDLADVVDLSALGSAITFTYDNGSYRANVGSFSIVDTNRTIEIWMGGSGADTYNVSRTATNPITLQGGSNSDTYNVTFGSLQGNVIIDDAASSTNIDVLNVTSTSNAALRISDSTGDARISQGTQVVRYDPGYNNIETINVVALAAPVTITAPTIGAEVINLRNNFTVKAQSVAWTGRIHAGLVSFETASTITINYDVVTRANGPITLLNSTGNIHLNAGLYSASADGYVGNGNGTITLTSTTGAITSSGLGWRTGTGPGGFHTWLDWALRFAKYTEASVNKDTGSIVQAGAFAWEEALYTTNGTQLRTAQGAIIQSTSGKLLLNAALGVGTAVSGTDVSPLSIFTSVAQLSVNTPTNRSSYIIEMDEVDNIASSTSGFLKLVSLFGKQTVTQPITATTDVILSGNQVQIDQRVTSSNNIYVYPTTPSLAMLFLPTTSTISSVPQASGGLLLTQAQLNNLFSSNIIYFGSAELLTKIYLGDRSLTTVTLPGPSVVLRGDEIHVLSPLRANHLFILGDGSTTTLSADVTGLSQTINDSVEVDGTRVMTATAGSIIIGNPGGQIDGNGVGGPDSLTMNA